ncbi:MAG: glycosyltransferase family 2 protein [Elusimicrobia bacterium]|nr:glycosyltransferase family 2 protein [Elusimicrobiota bacterium]
MPSIPPAVSVVIPTRDGAAWLGECLESLRRQTFTAFEVVLNDDASTDGTWELARRAAARDPRLRVSRNARPLGLVGNWNRGVALARAPWIKFLFQDDLLEPECLGRLLAARRPGVGLAICRRRFFFEPGVGEAIRAIYRRHLREHSVERRFRGARYVGPAEFGRVLLERPGYNCLGEPTAVLVERIAFRRWGLFNEELVNLCDWELLARFAANGGFVYVPETLASFRVHGRAATWANRERRRFRAEVLDHLLIRHELAFHPAFASLRRLAGHLSPPIDPRRRLFGAALRARSLARRFERDGRAPDPGATLALDALLRRYPRISRLPPLPSLDRYALAAARLAASRIES